MHETSKRSLPSGTLLRENRVRQEETLGTLSRETVAGGQREMPLGTLSQGFRVRWEAGRDTWHAFAGKPCQVGGRKMPPGTLLRRFRSRWTTGRCHPGRDTWHAFAGNRSRWAAGNATWNAFAGIPCQVDGRKVPPDTLGEVLPVEEGAP